MEKKQKFILMAVIMLIITTLFCCFGAKAFCDPTSQQWLNVHNNYRALHGVPPVTWNATIAARAQSWANTCPSGHSTKGSIYRPYGTGENMAHASYAQTAQGVVDRWYNEVTTCPYPYGEPAWDTCWGHFTQVVWNNTTQIGCACKNGCTSSYSICVCQYYPAGNVLGQFEENVFPPRKTPVWLFPLLLD